VQISVIHPDELGSTEIAAWHAMQDQTPALGNPFLCPEFAVTVGQSRPDARVAVLSDGPALAGFFPFERRGLGVGMPIGAGLSDCQGLVHAPGFDWDAKQLLMACGVAVWHFDHLVAGQRPFAPYQAATAASPVIDLADGFDAYTERLRARSVQFCRDVARKARKLEREVGQLRFAADSGDIGELRMLMTWKSEQYRRTGRTDRFDRPWIVEVVEKLLRYRQNDFKGVLSMLYAGDTPVAGHFGLRYGPVLGDWFPAYDAEFARYSPGLIQMLRMTEGLAGCGVRSIDLGKGDKRYKEQMKSYDLIVAEGTVTGGSALAAARRVQHAPGRWAVRQIRRHPRLFTAADRVLKRYGRLRVAVRPLR
jgi:CelD/BcsL family acetyltransferase involved in cellulose biosynthesis